MAFEITCNICNIRESFISFMLISNSSYLYETTVKKDIIPSEEIDPSLWGFFRQ